MPTLTTFIQHSTEVLASVIIQEKEIKGVQIKKEEVRLSLFADAMMLYVENPKDSTKTQLELIHEFSKGARYKINIQTSVVFQFTNNKLSERKIKKTIPFPIIIKKNKIVRNKINQGGERAIH